jgi:N-acyl-phosphatidylethanolamine-hydrolysing phospholipase D
MATTSLTTDSSSTDDELVKSRIENGCYVNSFNPEFKLPGFTAIFRWKFGESNNTRLPDDIEELNKSLPVLKPNPDEIWKTTPGLRFIWIGHASCLVQMDDFMFLTDPAFSDRCGITANIGPKRYRPPALTVDDLPDKLEAIVISHNHYDHLDYPSVMSLHKRYGNALTWFCGLGVRQWFRDCHIENVVELDWWEEWKHPV